MGRSLVHFTAITISCFFISCGYLRVTQLSPTKVCSIPSGTTLDAVTINYNESGLLDMSFAVMLSDSKIYIKDNIQKKVMICNREGKCEIVLGNVVASNEYKNIKKTQVKFDIIGAMVVDSDGNLYVQNRLSTFQRTSAVGTPIDMAPSYILVFDADGKLQYTIGQTGITTVPFYYIEHLEVDKKDRLFVISRTYDIWSVYRFTKRQRDFYTTFAKNFFTEVVDGNTYTGKIENIQIFQSGDDFILSVAYYHNTRFKYRKLYQYTIENSKVTELLKLSEPRNELYSIINGKYIYLWNVEDNFDIRFLVYNLDGSVIGTIKLEFPQNALFSDIVRDNNERFYSYHAYTSGIEIYEWK